MARRNQVLLGLSCLALLVFAGLVQAQFVGRSAAGLGGVRAGRGALGVGLGMTVGGWWPGVNYGGGYGYGGGTAAGNYAQGMSQVIRAQGEYNESTAKAMVDYQEARTKAIDNHAKWQQNYFALKEQNQAKQAEKAERNRPNQASLVAAAKAGAPKPLGPDQLDPVSGQIEWPDVLTAAAYSKPRGELDKLFELRAKTSGGPDTTEKIRQGSKELLDILRTNISNMSANEFMGARKFVESLEYMAILNG